MREIHPRSAWTVKKTQAVFGPYRQPGLHWGWVAFGVVCAACALIIKFVVAR